MAREYEIALPHELTPEQRSELVFGYAGWLAERHHVVVDVAIHSPHREGDQRNHHAHLLTTTRKVTGEGLGAKTRALDVARTSSGLIEEAREMWAEVCNDSLQRAQVLDQAIDHRSFERQGLDRTPTMHMGPEATSLERRGEISDADWWIDQANQLQQVPVVHADIMKGAEAYYAKERESGLALATAREQEREQAVKRSVQKSIEHGRSKGFGMDMD